MLSWPLSQSCGYFCHDNSFHSFGFLSTFFFSLSVNWLYLLLRSSSSACVCFFLPDASFGLRVLSSVASVGLCARVCVCQSRACPHDNSSLIRPFTERLVRAHPVHSDFRLSEPVDSYVNNLKNGVIISYINDGIKSVSIQKSVLYNDGNLVIILSTYFFSRKWQEKKD